MSRNNGNRARPPDTGIIKQELQANCIYYVEIKSGIKIFRRDVETTKSDAAI